MKNDQTKNEWGLITKLFMGIAVGTAIGLLANEQVMTVVSSVKYTLGQFIFFMMPLVIIGFITPAITRLRQNANKMLGAGITIAYLSAVVAATMAYFAGLLIIPHLSVPTSMEVLRQLPEAVFKLDIPPLMSVMSALVTAIVMGIAVLSSKATAFEKLLNEMEGIMLTVVTKMIIPMLPLLIAATFAGLAWQGTLTEQLPVFLKVVVVAILGHIVWLGVLYAIGGAISGKNPIEVIKHYGPAYMTAVGTMSSAATLPVALASARKSKVLSRETVDFFIPLGGTIHLAGSVLTETFFVMVISLMLYGTLPSFGTMITFILLFGIFAIGAPGVPGGTVMASMGLVVGVLGFDPAGVALLLAFFALQDSFGTAANITGDGAIALMLEGLFNKGEESAALPSDLKSAQMAASV
ncbi:dicarboxylate/amino acid:cation symporter [Endozoicomonas sp.]|uniref:dicarboxylate/amino acid:cation symporter n=1 Tax=Endozoicomonas sp. TaxID=1892382 RepID=UPI00288622F0|nr:dicarboxylate/amino acid:cation symporter [Endozoicomonas sp.]